MVRSVKYWFSFSALVESNWYLTNSQPILTRLWLKISQPNRPFCQKQRESSIFSLEWQLIDPIFAFHLYFKVTNVFDAAWIRGVFSVQCHGRNCHYMSNVISGMVQGNITFKHFYFLTLGDKFYLRLFAWRSQHNFTSYHWWV